LVKAPVCCDWKAQAANMQSFTLWHQATTEIPCRAHSISACLRRVFMGVVLHVHPFEANHTFNTTLTKWLQHLQQVWARLFEIS